MIERLSRIGVNYVELHVVGDVINYFVNIDIVHDTMQTSVFHWIVDNMRKMLFGTIFSLVRCERVPKVSAMSPGCDSPYCSCFFLFKCDLFCKYLVCTINMNQLHTCYVCLFRVSSSLKLASYFSEYKIHPFFAKSNEKSFKAQ